MTRRRIRRMITIAVAIAIVVIVIVVNLRSSRAPSRPPVLEPSQTLDPSRALDPAHLRGTPEPAAPEAPVQEADPHSPSAGSA